MKQNGQSRNTAEVLHDNADDAEKDGNPPSAPAAVRFRARRRPAFRRYLGSLTFDVKRDLLVALTILVAGNGAIGLMGLAGWAAAVLSVSGTLLAALLLLHAWRHSVPSGDIAAMQQRFELLEDRAWELSESEERYRQITDAFGDLVVLRDFENRIVTCNQSYADAFALTTEEIIGRNILPRGLVSDSAPGTDNDGKTGVNGGETVIAWLERDGQRCELVVERQGERRWYHWLDLPVRGERDGRTATLSVARDITSFKRSTELDAAARRQAEEASRAKSRFLAMASHEMRTPLNGIIGMSKLLSATGQTAEQGNYTAALERSGRSLLHLIEGMLDLTTIEAGRFALNPAWFDIRVMLSDTIELLYPAASARNLQLGLFVDPGVPAELFCDRERMRQIVINLLGNSIKFTSTGGISLWVTLEGNAARQIVMRVRDTGPGMGREDAERIFREFERIDDRNSRPADGAGLGLSISRALAEQFGGKLDIEHTGPDGSVFTFTLPLTDSMCRQAPVADSIQLAGKTIALDLPDGPETDCLTSMIAAHGGHVVATHNMTGDDKMAELVIVDAPDADKTANAMPYIDSDNRRIIAVLSPETRSHWPALKARGIGHWLMRPIRESTLLSVLGGTTPAADPPEVAGSGTVPAQPVARAEKSAGHVLLAEDNDINALLATAALSREGFTVQRVDNGEEAVSEFMARKSSGRDGFGVILMDMHMPVMDGLEAIARIRALEGKTTDPNDDGKGRVPILVLTADDASESREAAMAAGADGYLSKPVDPVELSARVCELSTGSADGEIARNTSTG